MTDNIFILEEDERGFTLRVKGEWQCEDIEGAEISVPLSYWDCVELQRTLAPMREWLREAMAAKATMPPSREELEELADPRGPYADDPAKRLWAQNELDRP